MVGIVYATRREAAPFLTLSSAIPLTTGPLPLFRTSLETHPGCIVVISGMGKVAATLAAVHLVLTYPVSVLVNAGLCGRLDMDKGWAVGDLLRINSAVEGDCDRFGPPEPAVDGDPQWFDNLESARLVTCDRPVFQGSLRRQLANVAELADMEGAAVARVAKCYGISWAMLKGISDNADEAGRQDVSRNIDPVSAHIAKTLVKELGRRLIDGQL